MNDQRLAKYREMRDFTRTAEPSGDGEVRATGERFVVQRHRARRRHYDLRLELDGVLVSWAVPKGPTLDPAVRRMAVRVEDHPLEYADFEGTIPADEYGGGDVIVWDRGTWDSPDEDPAAAIEAGTLHFDLHGEKLAGTFVLVRRGDKQWLLLHKKDEHAESGWDPEDHPRSVKSGRTNEEVAAAPEAMWRSDLPPSEAEIPLDTNEFRSEKRWEPPTAGELAALDELGAKGRWRLAGRDLALTNLDKVLFPGRDGEAPVTKRDLIRYHALIGPVMLPYLAGRPLNSHRFPNGVDQPGFWHKEVPSHAPDWLRRWRYEDAEPDDTQWYLVPDSVPALAWLANYAALELHAWTSRAADPQHPTWALFDIDPGSRTTFDEVLVLARLHRTAMEHLGVEARPKVTGQRGIQIWVPVEPRYTYAETRAWVEKVSKAVGGIVPELVSWAWTKQDRRGLARLDYTQNVINKTLVAPYSARPRPGAPVSVPLEWDELDDPDLAPDRWTIRTVLDRIAAVGDPFSALLGVEQRLPPV
ncbi:bifunctional non-homologous end joining protein LigD [Saccharopolyspora shandongensis]|uniref:Bifunctional non-homologous end joining protein LigD n=1 Tax=Saccharopolyspora shandongensis TaxID=418495 RepID=A0A1H3K3F7_9PSEU|nr:DNA polymerase ligase N-terminal domain-containing protein [Saccharopolyspora shandongensis]SDY46691.1 bifunctional non-homologous end joining protein LigD [Saccharopolyspora shandongensis]